jgi:hypothetical protein
MRTTLKASSLVIACASAQTPGECCSVQQAQQMIRQSFFWHGWDRHVIHAHCGFMWRTGDHLVSRRLRPRPSRREERSRPGRPRRSAGRARTRWTAGRARTRWTAGPARSARGALGPPGAPVRVVQSSCTSASCAAECRNDEVLLIAYCGPTRNPAVYPGERSASCRVRGGANSPLVAVCAKTSAQER